MSPPDEAGAPRPGTHAPLDADRPRAGGTDPERAGGADPERSGAISIVIPTHNRVGTFRGVAPTYLSQRGVGEIVVVDDGSDDGTAGFVAELRARDGRVVGVRHPTRRGLPAARNAGVAASTGQFVLFGEDDLRLLPGYAMTLRRCLERTGASIAGGRILYPFPGESDEEALERTSRGGDERIDRRRIAYDASFPPPGESRELEAPFLHAIGLVRRAVFDDVAFDPAFRGNAWREETDFYLRARRAGHRILFCPEAVCIHLPREVRVLGGAWSRGVWWHKYWTLRNDLLFLRRHHAYLKESGLASSSLVATFLYNAAMELRRIPAFYLRRYSPSAYASLARRLSR